MRTTFFFSLLLLLSNNMGAQLGIGNENPRGLLDVNDNPNGNATYGLVIPHTENVTLLQNPAENNEISDVSGTIAFDSDMDCIRFIRNNSEWSDCLSDGTGGMVAGSGLLSNISSLRFRDIDQVAGGTQVYGTTTSGDVYTWGRQSHTPLVLGRTPIKIDLPTGVRIRKTINVNGLGAMLLSENNELFAIGQELNSAYTGICEGMASATCTTPLRVPLPAGETSVLDMATIDNSGTSATFIIGNSGTAYFAGRITIVGLPVQTSNTYTSLTPPTGVTYTRVFAGAGVVSRAYFEGDDGNYYAYGQGLYGSLGSGITLTYNPITGLSRQSVPFTGSPVQVNFPSGVRIIKMSFNNPARGATIALSENGDAYFMGNVGNVSPSFNQPYEYIPIDDGDLPNIRTVQINTTTAHYASTPLLIAKPEGVSRFIDIDYSSGSGSLVGNVFAIGDNGRVYIYDLAATNSASSMEDTRTTHDSNTWEGEADFLSAIGNLEKLQVVGNSGFAIGSDGVAYHWGDTGVPSRSGAFDSTNIGTFHNFPVALVNGNIDSDNPNPEPQN